MTCNVVVAPSMARAKRAIKAFGLGDEWQPLTIGAPFRGMTYDKVVVLMEPDATQRYLYFVHRVGRHMRVSGEYPVVL